MFSNKSNDDELDLRWPLWLAPVRATVVPVGEAHKPYAMRLRRALLALSSNVDAVGDDVTQSAGADDTFTIAVDADASVSKRVRNAVAQHIPYVLIVGDSEVIQCVAWDLFFKKYVYINNDERLIPRLDGKQYCERASTWQQ